MTLNQKLVDKKLTKYRLSKLTQIPYTTICDLFNHKTKLENCTVDVVYRIAKALDTTVEDLLESDRFQEEQRIDFELFRSNLQHRVKEMGDLGFLDHFLSKDQISIYFSRNWLAEALYGLAMVDYLCRQNHLPLASKYNELRSMKLNQILYPSELLLLSKLTKNENLKAVTFENSIPEFKRFNIAEGDIRSVI